eukprot:TRINITY_DN67678_c0_g2_i1.p1 TRINITY_DN67678_c0_g2~~TRINITY_DN67678_c0_g2_i1.p1  ORF type:complete len:723 (-),score=105.87 TRINITY_DN67678_c0_g2_i1:42-2051(-)
MEAAPMKQNYFTIHNLLLAGYLFVVAVLLIRSLIKIGQIYRMVLGKDYTVVEDCKVIVLDRAIPAFTFFGYIVMNREEFTDESRINILAHEKVHAEQKHWIDLLLVELLTILVWFNPIVWLYQIAIKQTHELLADDGVIARGFNIGQYQATLINQIMGTEVLGLANNFNYSITKKRMIMMSNVKSPKNRRYKLLIVIPAVLVILLFNMKIVEVQAQEKIIEKVVNVTTVTGQILNEDNEPIAGVAVLVQDSKTGTVSDMEGRFSIQVPEDGKLVFLGVDLNKEVISVEGFIKHGKKTDNGYDMNVQLSSSSVKEVSEEKTYKGEPIFVIVEDMPVFPGGALKLKEFYEAEVSKLDKKYIIGKRSYVTFLVTKTGEVAEARIARSSGKKKVDAKALKIVMSSPKWKPGKQRGKAVHVSYTVPVNFGVKKGGSESKRFTIDPNTKDTTYVYVDEMPVFPGGTKALQNYIAATVKYPSEAFKKGVKGRVFVTFVVNKEGVVDQARVIRGVETSLDKEALRAVTAMPKWMPGIEKGKAVDVSYTVPINFDITDDKKIDEVKVDGKVFTIVEKMPEYPGGPKGLQKYIGANVKYPAEALKNNITGKVYIMFVVNKEGNVDQARVARGVEPSLDAEALRVIKSLPKWEPGMEKGKTVDVSYVVPINFDSTDDKKE